MSRPIAIPQVDPTPIFELYRGNYAAELLTAAVAHFDVFGRLARSPCTFDELRRQLLLAERPAIVLITALRAMQLVEKNSAGLLQLTPLAAEHLVPGAELDVGDYLGLSACSPGVLELVRRLKSNQPAGLDRDGPGTAFIYRAGVASAMEQDEWARHFTLALAGRAKNVAPVLARQVPLPQAKLLLDVGGGSGIFSIAYLRQFPQLRAIVFDRPAVLTTAEQFAQRFGVTDRIELRSGDMFVDPLPEADAVLLSNVLHDWDVAACRELVQRCANSLRPEGRIVIHDVLLNDDLDGPLPIALYSAALFSLTEGRAYSAAEYGVWLADAGLKPAPPVPTLIHCHAIVGTSLARQSRKTKARGRT
jgi:predicted O-methyltransferase YrrM